MSMSSGAEESTLKGGLLRLMLYAGLFGTCIYSHNWIHYTLYNQGIKFFGHIAYTCITLTFGLFSCWAYPVFSLALPSSSLGSTED